ncbi:MAG: helix-turn-helix domain-containing protein [Candidatus Thiodiazotropha sp. LLP2]
MNNSTKSPPRKLPIATRLSSLRTTAGLSLDRLAEQSGLTKSYLSKLERGLSEPSISTVARLAEAFDISVSEFVGDQVSRDGFRVVRSQDRRELPSTTQIPLFELLHGNSSPQGGRLNAYIQYPEMVSEKVQSDTPQAIHSGEEFILVLSGEIQLCVADKEEILESGDGAWYLSEFVHKLRSLGDQRATVLVVTCSCAKATR